MKIRTQLTISMAVFSVALLIILGLAIYTNQQVDQLNDQQEIVKDIEIQMGVLGYISNDFILNHDSQQVSWWEETSSAIADAIARLDPSRPDQAATVAAIISDHQRLDAVFGDVVATTSSGTDASPATDDPSAFRVSWSRIAIQQQSMLFDVDRLSQILDAEELRLKETMNILISAFGLALIAFLSTLLFLFYRRTLVSLAAVQNGTNVIGSGNFDYAIPETSDDEIGALSHAFNQMAANLKTVTASKTDLEREIAERRQAEAALLESEEKFRNLVDLSPDAIILEREGVIVYANPAALHLYGAATLDDLTTRKRLDLIHPEYREIVEARMYELREKGYLAPLAIKIVRLDGTTVDVETTGSLTRINGIPHGQIMVRDITERKRAEMAVHESKDLLARELKDTMLLQSISEALIQSDRIEDLYEQIVDAAASIMHSDFASLQMLYPERGMGGELRLLACRGFTPEAATFWEWVRPDSESSCGVALRSGMRVITDDVETSAFRDSSGDLATYRQTGIRAVQTTPLRSRSGTIVGMISTHWRVPHRPTDRDLRLLDILARQAADLIERGKTEEVRTADLDALTRMHDISGRLLDQRGLQPLLQEIMDTAVAVMGAGKGTLQLVEGDSLRIVAAHGHEQPFLDFFASAEQQASACGAAMRACARVVVPDVETSDLFAGTPSLSVLHAAGVRSIQSTPMTSRSGALLGVLTTQWGVPHTPSEHDLWRLDLLVRQAADTIEYTRAGEALRESEERFRAFMDNSPAVAWIKDDHGRYVYLNRTGQDRFDLRPEDYLGKTDVDLWPPEIARQIAENDRSVLHDHRATEVVEEVQNIEGEIVYSQNLKFPLRDLSGRLYVGGIGIDITDRRQAERERAELLEQVRQERDKIQTIVSSIADDVWFVDTDRRTVLMNPAVVTTLGLGDDERQTLDEILASLEILDPDGTPRPKDEAPLIRSLRGEVLSGDEMVRHRVTGELRYRHYHSAPVRDSTGRIVGAVAVVSDVTEQKEATERLREYAANLKRSNEDLERFAYVSSHDLQEPLRNVVIYTQLLARKYQGQFDSDADDYINYIVSGGQRMQKLINDLLDFSRITSKGKSFGLTNVDSVVQQVESSVYQFHGVDGAVITRDSLPTIIADESQLFMVFQNLIGNAIKFRRGDPARVHIGAERIGHGWKFSVRDNGIGIAPEYYDRIFVIFQRLHNQTRYGGTGIGLAIVKRIIDRHGGRVWVESEPGNGSTFYFTMPDTPLKSAGTNGGGGETTFDL